MKLFDIHKLNEALMLLNEQLILNDNATTELVVCGGSALIATGLVPRTTQDVDIIALMESETLTDSETLPNYLVVAAEKVGKILKLPRGWLNNGPASQFQMGLPQGFQERLTKVVIGQKLTVHYISRYDQIFFKTYAAADQAGYHVSDLKALNPTTDELISAAKWCLTQDTSEAFNMILKDMFKQLGWNDVANQL